MECEDARGQRPARGRDFYWSYNSNVLTAEVAPGVGAAVALTYRGMFPILVTNGSTRRSSPPCAGGRTGVYEAITDDPAINVQNVAVQKALAYLRKHGVIPQTIRFETDRPGLRPGQLLPVRVATAGLDDNYLIESVNMRDVQGAVNDIR